MKHQTILFKCLSVILSIIICFQVIEIGVSAAVFQYDSSSTYNDFENAYSSDLLIFSGTHTWDVRRAGTFSIDDYTLQPTLSFEGLSVIHNIFPVDITYSYNTKGSTILSDIYNITDSVYGTGFLPNCFSFITEISFTDKTFLLLYDDSSTVLFEPDEDNTTTDEWINEANGTVIQKLDPPENGVKYRMTDGELTNSFDILGRLVRTENNSSGEGRSYEYDSSVFEKINKITDGIGNEFIFTYTDGKLTKIKCFKPDASALLVGDGDAARPLEVNLSYTNDKLSEFVFPDGIAISFGYTGDKLSEIETADGGKLDITYTDGLVSRVDVKAFEEHLADYVTGDFLKIEINGTSHRFEDAFGNVENKTFDEDGNILSVTDENGEYLFGEPDNNMSPEEETTDPTESELGDEQENDATEPFPDAGCSCSGCTDFECYCTCENEEECTCISCRRNKYSNYDIHGNSISDNSFDGFKTLSELRSYTSNGAYTASTTDSAGNTVFYTYSDAGFLTSASTGAATSEMTYDAVGNLLSFAQEVEGLSNGSEMSNVYTYDNDKISSITHNGFTYDFNYDLWGNRTTVSIGSRELYEKEYNSAEFHDTVSQISFANGQEIRYNYNDKGILISVGVDDESGNRFEYAYEDGILTEISDLCSGIKTVYTNHGTEIRTSGDELLFSNATNEEGDIVQFYSGGVYEFSEDSAYNPVNGYTTVTLTAAAELSQRVEDTEIGISVENEAEVKRDWFGRVTDKSYSVSVSATGSDDHEAVITDSSSVSIVYYETADTATTRIFSYATTLGGDTVKEYYEYDVLGNISGVYRYEDGIKTYYNRYYYDEASQLIREDDRPGNKTVLYRYDVGGNIVSANEYVYTEGDVGELTPQSTKSFGYNDSVWHDVLTSINGLPVTTDALGNVTSVTGSDSYEWTGGRQLSKNTHANGEYEVYRYDSEGKLIGYDAFDENGIRQGGYSYYWDDDRLAVMSISSADNQHYYSRVMYDSEGEAVGFMLNDISPFVYRKNIFGDITGICSQGQLIVEYSYDAWGNPTAAVPEGATSSENIANVALALFVTAFNPLLYRGYLYTQLDGTFAYYLGSRFYVPSLYRFMNADVYEDTESGVVSTNMFAYCNNNPISNIDPDGKLSIPLFTITSLVTAVCTAVLLVSIANVLYDLLQQAFSKIEIKSAINSDSILKNNCTAKYKRYLLGLSVQVIAQLQSAVNNVLPKIKLFLNKTEIHHIIAKTAPKADIARNIFLLHTHNINDSRNLVPLKYGFHKVLHTTAYYYSVNELIKSANKKGQEGVFNMLLLIRTVLLIADKQAY